jgi:hypothetical protein
VKQLKFVAIQFFMMTVGLSAVANAQMVLGTYGGDVQYSEGGNPTVTCKLQLQWALTGSSLAQRYEGFCPGSPPDKPTYWGFIEYDVSENKLFYYGQEVGVISDREIRITDAAFVPKVLYNAVGTVDSSDHFRWSDTTWIDGYVASQSGTLERIPE